MFEKIKAGLLPTDEQIIAFLKDPTPTDQIEEVKRYIDLLEAAYKQSNHVSEACYIAKVLLVLETMAGKEEAIQAFFRRVFFLHVHEAEMLEWLIKELFSMIDHQTYRMFLSSELSAIVLRCEAVDDITIRNFLNWNLHLGWTRPKFSVHPLWRDLYDVLKALLACLVDQKRRAMAMYVEFFICHTMGNLFQTTNEWRRYNKEITKSTAALYKDPSLPMPPKDYHHAKKRVALLKDRIVFNSIFQVEFSLLKALQEDKRFKASYEIAVYSCNYFEKSDDDPLCIRRLEGIGVPYINPVAYFKEEGYYHSHEEKARTLRKALMEDEIDIIITGGIFPVIDFLYINRAAPKMVYWSHGNCAFDLEGIDQRISHFKQDCEEFAWDYFQVLMEREFLMGTPEQKERGMALKRRLLMRFGDKTIFLGTIGRMIKIDSLPYLEAVAKIMQKNPHTVYLACGPGNEDAIRQKLKEVGIDERRFIFTGEIDAHVYGWVIDVWLDTFPLEQGQSKHEFATKKGTRFVVEYKDEP